MKVLIINGSPRIDGNTQISCLEMMKIFKKENIETEIYQVATKNIRGCIACNSCKVNGKCVFDDDVNYLKNVLKDCDGLVIASPVYYSSANGTLISLLDRLFYSNNNDLSMKVGASVVVARRGGASSTFDELNKYFTISGMPICSSNYWNSVHGQSKAEALQDEEGLQTIRLLARNMVFLMKSIALGKEKFGMVEKEKRIYTNFIKK